MLRRITNYYICCYKARIELLNSTFAPMMGEVIGGWRMFGSEELLDS